MKGACWQMLWCHELLLILDLSFNFRAPVLQNHTDSLELMKPENSIIFILNQLVVYLTLSCMSNGDAWWFISLSALLEKDNYFRHAPFSENIEIGMRSTLRSIEKRFHYSDSELTHWLNSVSFRKDYALRRWT